MKTLIIMLFFLSQKAWNIHCINSENKEIYLNHDVSYEIMRNFSAKELANYRLVCWQWRVTIDELLEHYIKINNAPKQIPEDDNFFRIASFELGRENFSKKEYKKAFKFYSLSANYRCGNITAIYILGNLFLRGLGTPRNIKEGIYQLMRLVKYDNKDAIYDLGLIFLSGMIDNEVVKRLESYQNYEQAFILFKKGSELNCEKCIYHLGLMYHQGYYVEKDKQIGKDLFNQSAQMGYKLARKILNNASDYNVE